MDRNAGIPLEPELKGPHEPVLGVHQDVGEEDDPGGGVAHHVSRLTKHARH